MGLIMTDQIKQLLDKADEFYKVRNDIQLMCNSISVVDQIKLYKLTVEMYKLTQGNVPPILRESLVIPSILESLSNHEIVFFNEADSSLIRGPYIEQCTFNSAASLTDVGGCRWRNIYLDNTEELNELIGLVKQFITETKCKTFFLRGLNVDLKYFTLTSFIDYVTRV